MSITSSILFFFSMNYILDDFDGFGKGLALPFAFYIIMHFPFFLPSEIIH